MSTTALALGQMAGRLGRLMGRYPRPIFGGLGFAAIFGAIAANALWYQPHRLQQPFLVTRDFGDFDALPGIRPKAAPPADMTTYRIEREEPEVVVETDDPATASASASDTAHGTAAALPGAHASPGALPRQPENVALAVAVQQALIERGLYDGVPDGVIGPRTAAAILFFQQTSGLPETGEVSEDLLKALAADGSLARRASTASIPATPRPKAKVEEEDPVAAAILNADVPAPAAKPARTARPAPEAAAAAGDETAPVVKASSNGDALADLIRAGGEEGPDSGLVLRIQEGLSRMQYRDVTPDGVLGEGTRAAIRKFEKDYGLPLTGEPSERVLKKLREIGMV
jgi:peptidoglycan hydrolase-like protein with peptidoglycan-binding domain